MNDQRPENLANAESHLTPKLDANDVATAIQNRDLVNQQLSMKSVVLDRWIGYTVLCVLMLIVFCSSSPAFLIMPWWGVWAVIAGWCSLAGVLFFFAHVHPRWAYERTRWGLTEEGFEIRRGIIWRHQIAIPAARVQHVDVSQGPLQRIYDLGKLTIHTAGTANASIELSGLEHSIALSLRDDLIRQKEMLDVA